MMDGGRGVREGAGPWYPGVLSPGPVTGGSRHCAQLREPPGARVLRQGCCRDCWAHLPMGLEAGGCPSPGDGGTRGFYRLAPVAGIWVLFLCSLVAVPSMS